MERRRLHEAVSLRRQLAENNPTYRAKPTVKLKVKIACKATALDASCADYLINIGAPRTPEYGASEFGRLSGATCVMK